MLNIFLNHNSKVTQNYPTRMHKDKTPELIQTFYSGN